MNGMSNRPLRTNAIRVAFMNHKLRPAILRILGAKKTASSVGSALWVLWEDASRSPYAFDLVRGHPKSPPDLLAAVYHDAAKMLNAAYWVYIHPNVSDETISEILQDPDFHDKYGDRNTMDPKKIRVRPRSATLTGW